MSPPAACARNIPFRSSRACPARLGAGLALGGSLLLSAAGTSAADCTASRAVYSAKHGGEFTLAFSGNGEIEGLPKGVVIRSKETGKQYSLDWTVQNGYPAEYLVSENPSISVRLYTFDPDWTLGGIVARDDPAPHALFLPDLGNQTYGLMRADEMDEVLPETMWLLSGCEAG